MFILAPIRWALRLFATLLTVAVLYLIVSGAQVIAASRQSSLAAAVHKSAAVLVAGSTSTSALSSDLSNRLGQALALYRARVAPVIIVTGPSSSSGSSSVTSETSYFVARGVPSSAVHVAQGANFVACLRASESVVGVHGKVIIVTDAVNSLVAEHQASALGLVAKVSPSPQSKVSVFEEAEPLFNNAAAVAAGRLIGFERVSWSDW